MLALARAVQRLLLRQASVVEVAAPTKIFGDVHGQLRDLLLLMLQFGFPYADEGDACDIDVGVSYIFNGNFVDSGPHQLETVMLLFALKLVYPDNVHMLRGRHEFVEQNALVDKTCGCGFQTACTDAVAAAWGGGTDPSPDVRAAASAAGAVVFDAVHAAFSCLPLAAVVDDRVVVVHGGIGDERVTLAALRAVPRPLAQLRASEHPAAYYALWSDPQGADDATHTHEPLLADDTRPGEREVRIVEELFALFDPSRSTATATTGPASRVLGLRSTGKESPCKTFGPSVTERWLAREGAELLVCAHQVLPQGHHTMHGGKLWTVFSARDYDRAQPNAAAVLFLAKCGDGSLRITHVQPREASLPDRSHHYCSSNGVGTLLSNVPENARNRHQPFPGHDPDTEAASLPHAYRHRPLHRQPSRQGRQHLLPLRCGTLFPLPSGLPAEIVRRRVRRAYLGQTLPDLRDV